MSQNHPIAIIGAGPVGLAAAAHLIERGLEPFIFEKGDCPGAAVGEWGHVRVFTPWRYILDQSASKMLRSSGWSEPDLGYLPKGKEILEQYIKPLGELPDIARNLHLNARVTAVTRDGLGKLQTAEREQAPFVVHWEDAEGRARQTLAEAVIDASGTWGQPSPVGVGGIPVPGEANAADHIYYGIPDVLGKERARYSGRRVMVVGGGHSAMNAVLDLLSLRAEVPETTIFWATKRRGTDQIVGGGSNDQLPARGQLGLEAARAIEKGDLAHVAPFAITDVSSTSERLLVDGFFAGKRHSIEVDELVVCTGFRPETSMLRELRLELDPVMEAPPKLAPLIDPNVHSCGTVPPHGADELRHPEPGFYIVGMKSYGRAPTFLMVTGYEQVRSISAELAGDQRSAREVHLQLPETGVCSAEQSVGGCCSTKETEAGAQERAKSCCG